MGRLITRLHCGCERLLSCAKFWILLGVLFFLVSFTVRHSVCNDETCNFFYASKTLAGTCTSNLFRNDRSQMSSKFINVCSLIKFSLINGVSVCAIFITICLY